MVAEAVAKTEVGRIGVADDERPRSAGEAVEYLRRETTDAASLAPPNSTMRPTRFSYLNWNLWHTWEHYGNIVVYLRMNGLVPPSSEGSQMQMPAAKPPASD